jgi:hypothetical protein
VITVVVPVSPIPSHPDTSILEETLTSVRHHLPDAEIIVCFDGVRPEQDSRRSDYEEHIRRMLWRLDKHYGNTVPFIFDHHVHQVGMLRRVIDEIRTPLMLFCEQDTPLVIDELIAWPTVIEYLMAGHADSVRFAHEAMVHPEHAHMTVGTDGLFLQTCQFSARPHVATVAYYRRILESHFSPDACCFTEDVMHGVCHEAYRLDGMQGWRQHKLTLYHPIGGNIKRSYHTDGRAGEAKFDRDQIF